MKKILEIMTEILITIGEIGILCAIGTKNRIVYVWYYLLMIAAAYIVKRIIGKEKYGKGYYIRNR